MNGKFNYVKKYKARPRELGRGQDQFNQPLNRMNGFQNMTIFTIRSTTTTTTNITTRTSCIVPCP
jgi:hypothetical protein